MGMGHVPPSRPKPGYCFCCGEDGYVKPQCGNPPNPTLVAMKRKEFTEKRAEMAEFEPDYSAFKLEPVPVKGRTGTTVDQQCPTNQKPAECAKLRKSTTGTWRLPKGLLGSHCTAVVNISGHVCHCLLDTGSQVTTIPVSLYNQHFSDQSVKSLHDLLQEEGAAG